MAKTRNRLIAVGIALLLIIAAAVFIFPTKSANADVWDGTVAQGFVSGTGTADDPFLISNGAELALLAQKSEYPPNNSCFKLTADIDLGGRDWKPIGNNDVPFGGIFDGNGCTISNLKLKVEGWGKYAGLFGYNSGTIKNVYLADVDAYNRNGAGAAGLCAVNNFGGTIEGCAVLSGKIETSDTLGAGGVAGICSDNFGTINKCYNMAAVKTDMTGAGVVCANKDNAIVSNCYNAGEVSSTENSGTVIGGISSINWGKIEYCFNYGNVNNGEIVEGICGQNDDNPERGTISSCYSDSTVCKAGAVGTGRNLTDVGTMTTEVLCGDEFLSSYGFDDSVWQGGDYEVKPNGSEPDIKFGTLTVRYPTLVGVSKEQSKKYEVYNFKTDGTDDWQRYTLIENKEDFLAIGRDENKWNENYVLGADLDLMREEVTPIGNLQAFTGKFSGDGHTISGVNVNVTNQNDPAGLFGYSTGVIMNLAVVGEVRGTNSVGGICGSNSAADGNGIIYACSFKGIVAGTGNNIGGICGYNFQGNSKISNCFSAAYVTGNNEVGGICGYNATNATVSNSISVCEVSGSGNLVAAVCGKNDGTLKDNYFDTTVCSLGGAIDNTGNECASGTTDKPTEELCDETIMRGDLDTNMWNLGKILYTYDRSNARRRVTTYTYPSLKGIAGSVYSTEVKEYNFSTDGNSSWRTYTEINSADDFIALGNDESLGGNYVLTADIDLSGKKVTPIGTNIILAFTGNFSGDGHTISGVNISGNDNVGLFGVAGDSSGNTTTIMNLAVEGNITGKKCVGGICGYGENYVNIYACSFKGSVSGEDCVGGICGEINRSCEIKNCFNSGTIKGTGDVGGLLGYVSDVGHVNYNINVGEVSSTTSANPICGAVSNKLHAENNYYDSKTFSGTDSYGTAKTTDELCADDALTTLNLDTNIWQAGGITRTKDAKNPRMSVANTNYPSLKGVGEPLSLGEEKQYNFKTDGADDWQEYTEINSAADLAKINQNPNGCYVLMKDITLGKFTPIETFSGKFSGDGYTISGVKISGGTRGGLFDWNKGLIMNLAVEGDVTGVNAGGICEGNYGTIFACSFKGSVKGETYVGGICGLNTSTGTISNCYVIGSVEATSDTAGIAGGICGKNDNDNGYGSIKYCYFAGTSASPYNYNAICYGPSNDCYYDSELFNINSNLSEAIATEKLCDSNNLPDKFSTDIWETGKFSVTSNDGRFRTVSFTYPRLKEGCAAYKVNDVKQYNFGMDGKDNWAQFNEINSLADLNNINKNPHTNYVQMKDIDLNGGTFSPLVPNSSFWGNFSGNGHTIKGDIVGNKNRRDNAFTALFSSNNGLIMNLAVKCDVSGVDYVGGICGRNNGTIYGCSFEGSVKGKKWVGGICGEMRSGEGERISNCYVIGSIEATNTLAGGISGESKGASSDYVDFVPPSIKNCYFVGTVTVPDGGKKDAITVKTTDTAKVLTVENCYYNKDIYTGSTTYGEGKTTKELCTLQTLGSAFESGEYSDAPDAKNERKRTVSGKYPSLKEGCAAYELNTVKQYNFGINVADDWQEYTEINSAADLAKINQNPNGCYVLMKDITLGKFTPIETFSGKFSGDGYTISNVIITGKDRVGLFGYCTDGTIIMNLAVANGDISGTGAYVGGICGYLFSENKDCSIINCSFEGSVKGDRWVGGICGAVYNGTISNCYAIADVEATGTDVNYENSAGGICGLYSPGVLDNKGKISNCYFAGTVKGSDANYIDAICGTNNVSGGGGISNCYYNSDLYTAGSKKGKGLSTLEMTSSGVISTFGGSGVWKKNDNKLADSSGKNGIAYYPALVGSNYVPSVKFNASLTFERTDNKALTFLDEFDVKYGGVIEFANGVKVDLNETNCVLTAFYDNDENNSVSLTASPSKITVTKAGKTTYTFKCVRNDTIKEFLPSAGLTKSLTINAAKYTLKAEDFNVIQPQVKDSTYDGKAKSTTVKIVNDNLSKYGGCGDITLRYFDSNDKEVVPINAGDYTVKIDVAESANCKAAKALTSPSWKKLEITAAIPPATDYEFSVSRDAKTYTLSVVELPDDLGEIKSFTWKWNSGVDGVITKAELNGKNIIFTLDGSKGDNETVNFDIVSQNYGRFGFDVTANLNDNENQSAPKCEVTLTHDENAQTYTATITRVDGAQYSFDGKKWDDTNTLTGIKHGAKVNASIRMAATANMNASENVTKTLTAGADLKWEHDETQHWQKCTECDYKTDKSAHIFNGNSCAVCGYKKSGGTTGGGGSSSGGGGSHSGGGSSGGGSSRSNNPAVDGKEMTWNDVANEINKLTEGGEATIDLNGNTTVPKDVIKAIKDKKALVTIKVNSTFSWTIDGSKLTDSDIKDIDFMVSIKTASGTETLRGTVGTGFKIDNVTDKAVLNITFKAAHSGKFANLYKKSDGKLIFVDNVKIDENGNALGLEVYEKGEYAVMLGEFSDRAGDMDNDGILNAKDALAVLRHSAMIENGKNPAVADMDGDNVICAKDALIILKIAAGIIKI